MNQQPSISLYRPSPVLLPQSLKQHPQIQAILLEYLEEVVHGNNSKAPIRLAWDLNDDPQLRANQMRVDAGAGHGADSGSDQTTTASVKHERPYNQFNHPPKSTYTPLPKSDKLRLLQENIPLAFDTFIHGNKLVTLGPALPELDELIGRPQLLLRRRGDDGMNKNGISKNERDDNNRDTALEIKYFSESINYRLCSGRNIIYSNALKYSIATNLPQELLSNPNNWQLEFRYKFILDGKQEEFSSKINLQTNPFAGGTTNGQVAKSTLVTLQKDNPPELIKEWCEYYYTKHHIQRIIIYNNGGLGGNNAAGDGAGGAGGNTGGDAGKSDQYNRELLSQLTKWHASLQNKEQHPLDLHLIEWDYSYQSYFTQCQTGALTHCYWLVGEAASYILNFDLDEYLVNQTARSLDNCLAPAISTHKGINIKGYESTSINLDNLGNLNGQGDLTSQRERNNATLNEQGTGNSIPKEHRSMGNMNESYKIGEIGKIGNIKKSIPANPKYIAAPNHWQVLTPHSLLKKNFFPAPPSWHLLTAKDHRRTSIERDKQAKITETEIVTEAITKSSERTNATIKFTLAKIFYRLSVRLFYILQGTKRRIGLKELPSAMHKLQHTSNHLYFIHRRSTQTTSWKWKS